MTTWQGISEQIVHEASDIKIGKVVVTVVAAPFFALGYLIGLVWFVLTLVWQAGWVGAGSAARTLKRD